MVGVCVVASAPRGVSPGGGTSSCSCSSSSSRLRTSLGDSLLLRRGPQPCSGRHAGSGSGRAGTVLGGGASGGRRGPGRGRVCVVRAEFGGGGAGGGRGPGSRSWLSLSGTSVAALVSSAFVMGIGFGVAFESAVDIEPSNVASREFFDASAPNRDVCIQNGFPAMVMDQRQFVTFNPFNIYAMQSEVKPGCVLRRATAAVLEERDLLTQDEFLECKNKMNTFGWVGDLEKSPEVSCLYHSEMAENQFLRDPKRAVLGDGVRARPDPELAR